jgi:arylsulfatase A-like enzyme
MKVRALKYIILGILIFIIFTIFFVSGSCKNARSRNFNIVLIVIDTLRSDHLPFYGYKKNTAPFLNELSKKAVVFRSAYSASSWTSPATASIFTSLYPFQHGVLMGLHGIRIARKVNPDIKLNKIPAEITTITEVLKKKGYKTYGIADNWNIDEKQGFTQGFDKFQTFGYETAAVVNETLLKWQEEIMNSRKYFLYIHYMDPHVPYHRREPWYKPGKNKKEHRISCYDSEINYVDKHIREIFNSFLWDKNTLLIITSDHGEGLMDHLKWGHGNSLYREEIQVPLLIYLPGGKIYRRININVSTIDILPTVRDLTGLPVDRNDAGVSLVPLIENRKNNLHNRYLFSHLLWAKLAEREIEFRTTIYKDWHFIIRSPRKWKQEVGKEDDLSDAKYFGWRYLLRNPDNKELFHIKDDEKEEINKILEEGEIAGILEGKLKEFMVKCKKIKQKSFDYKLNKEEEKKLKSLGYIH